MGIKSSQVKPYMTSKIVSELIITTYNNPFALNLVLYSLLHQDDKDFNICIADDGSTEQTKIMVENWGKKFGDERFRFVWHADNGFQKNKILNKAIETSKADYLIFIDGDCIAAPWFIARHKNQSKKNYFLSGGVVRMPDSATPKLQQEIIQSREIFSIEWLKKNNSLLTIGDYLKSSFFPLQISTILESVSPVKCTWNGGNSSGWREDIMRVNGFNESMTYGAEDVELGIRLNNFGVKGIHVRYSATLLHIEHSRSYANQEVVLKNKKHIKKIKNSIEYWTNNGIKKSTIPELFLE